MYGPLDELSYTLVAVAVAAEIIGLTSSDQAKMAKRIEATLFSTRVRSSRRAIRRGAEGITAVHALRFFLRDVRPAIKARRAQRQNDVISHLIDSGYPDRAILVECMTYAVAGMVTTREFIVMAAWHLFGDDDLRARFVAADETDQNAILEEILRLEPVAALLHRRADQDITFAGETATKGDVLAINIRAANVDPRIGRSLPTRARPGPGQQAEGRRVVHELRGRQPPLPGLPGRDSRVEDLPDALVKVPGIRLERAPDMTWCDGLMSYELRDAVIACERA